MMLLGVTRAIPDPYNLGQANSAFYFPSGSSPSAYPNQCVVWDHSSNTQCFCTNTNIGPTMMIDPSTIPPSYWLKTLFGWWDSTNIYESLLQVTFQDLFSTGQQTSSQGVTWSMTNTKTFGPTEVYHQIEIFNQIPYLKRYFFTGPNVVGSPIMWGGPGTSPTNCQYLPTGPIIGIRNFLDPSGYYCGADFAYNLCACTSQLFMLTDYSLQTINWQIGDPPVSLAQTIFNSLDGSTFPNTNCGDFLLSPVTTIINGYTPAIIVNNAGFITSTVGNPSSITLTVTDLTISGTFDVLLQITNPSGYNILGDTSLYIATPLYFYIKVIIQCFPSFTLASQPESTFYYNIQPVSLVQTTLNAILFTDSAGCGFVPTFTCYLGGVLCPLWISIDASKKMAVNTNSPANIGLKTISIKSTYISSLGVTVDLPVTPWLLNVLECVPAFTATTQPESPVNYTVLPTSSTFTTIGAIQFYDTNACGIVSTYSCKLISGSACPSWITINASNKMTVNTNNPANIGQQTINYSGTYVSQLGVIVALPPSAWVLNVNECIPAFKLMTKPEGNVITPFTFTLFVDTTLTTIAAILFSDSNSCGILPSYNCPLCPTYVLLNGQNKINVNGPLPLNAGQQTIQILGSYVSQWLGTTVALPNTAWYLNIIDPCATTSLNPVNFIEIKSLVGLQITASYVEFQNAFGSVCGDQTQSISPLTSFQTWTSTGSHMTNDLKYTLGFDARFLNKGEKYTELISVFLNSYPQVKATFVQKITVYSATLSQIADQIYTTDVPQLSIPFQVQWLPEVPDLTNPTYFLVTEGLLITFKGQVPANQKLPSSPAFYIKVSLTNFDIYNQVAKNAGTYQIQYSITFMKYTTIGQSLTFNLVIQPPQDPFLFNLLPDFVKPNGWPTKVILGCSQAFVIEVPPCEDQNQGDICSEKIELGAAMLFADYDPDQRKIVIKKDSLIPDFQGIYEPKVIISDGKGTNTKTFQLQVACNEWHLQPSKTLTDQWKVVDGPVIPTISRINNMGKVWITFSEPMKPVNHTNITNGIIKAMDVTWPAISVQIKPYDAHKFLDFTWECTNYTNTSLELLLNFTSPNQVSYSSPRDEIQITFWGQPYYVSQTGKYVEFGYNATHIVPTQIDQELGQKFAAVGDAIGQTGKGLVITAFFLNLVLSGSLQQLISQIQKLQIIVHQILVNLPIPASTSIVFGYLLQVVSFDVIPTDDFYDKYLNLPTSVALTDTFQSVGYESKFFLRNAGSIGLYFAVYLFSLLFLVILGKSEYIQLFFRKTGFSMKIQNQQSQSECQCKKAQKIYKWMKEILVWNYWHGLVEESYLVLVVCTMIQLLQYSEDDLTFYGRLINFTCAVLCSPALFIHVFMVATILCYNFEYIKKMHPDTEKFSKLFEDLQIRTNVSNRKEVYSGKHTISHPIWSILRRLILGVTVTTMTEYPLWCLLIMNFTTLTSIIIVGTQEPFKDHAIRSMDLFNEFFVLLINYHLLCFTNFVSDPVAREYLGYSMVVVLLLFLTINSTFVIIRMSRKPCSRLKYCIIRTKNNIKRNEARKTAQNFIASKSSAKSVVTDDDVIKFSLMPVKTKKNKRQQKKVTKEPENDTWEDPILARPKERAQVRENRLTILTLIKKKHAQYPFKTEKFPSFAAELDARMEKEFGKNSKQSLTLAGQARNWFNQMLAQKAESQQHSTMHNTIVDDDKKRIQQFQTLEQQRSDLRLRMHEGKTITQIVAKKPNNFIFGEGISRPNLDEQSVPEYQLRFTDLQAEGVNQRLQAQLHRERPWLRDFIP